MRAVSSSLGGLASRQEVVDISVKRAVEPEWDVPDDFREAAGADAGSGNWWDPSLLPVLDAGERLPGWDVVFGSHTFQEITNYWLTRFLRTPATSINTTSHGSTRKRRCNPQTHPLPADHYGSSGVKIKRAIF